MIGIRESEKHEASMYELVNRVRDAVYQIHKLTAYETTTDAGDAEKGTQLHHLVNEFSAPIIELFPDYSIWITATVFLLLVDWGSKLEPKTNRFYHLEERLKAEKHDPIIIGGGLSFPRTFADRVSDSLNIAGRKAPVLSLGNIEGARRVRYTDTKGVVHESPLPHTLGYLLNKKEVQEAFERYDYQLDLKSPRFMRPLIAGREYQPLSVGPGGHIDSDDASGLAGMFDREWPEGLDRPISRPAHYTYPTHGDITRGFIQLTGRRLYQRFDHPDQAAEKFLWYTGVHHSHLYSQQLLSARMGFDYPKVKVTLDYKAGGLFLNGQLMHCWPEGQKHVKQAVESLLPSKEQIQIAFFGALREPTVKPQFSKGKRLK